MRRLIEFKALFFCGALALTLALPTFQLVTQFFPRGQLYGYTDETPARPASLTFGLLDKSTQKWIEKYFDANLGFRAALVRTFNEVNFLLFREAPRLRLLSTPDRGLYSGMSIDNLNAEIIHKTELENEYRIEAKKLRQVQDKLVAQGKYFEVIIASSKPYVYPKPLGSRYLYGGGDEIFNRAASFGEILKSEGVNALDSGPMLRQFVGASGIETHPSSGVHWNYYAGCIAAARVSEDARSHQFPEMPVLNCGTPVFEPPHMIDTDGYQLLNLWSDGGLLKPSPYPAITPSPTSTWQPDIVFIGDSFSDQMRYAFQQANQYSQMVMSSYFRTRQIEGRPNDIMAKEQVENQKGIQDAVIRDVLQSDIVILEMVDYNVPRWGYGFSDYFLENYLQLGATEISRANQIKIESVTGAYDREHDDANWWHWVAHKITFKLRPISPSRNANQVKINFAYGTRTKQILTLIATTRDGSHQKVLIKTDGESSAVFEHIFDMAADELAEVSIESDGEPYSLGPGDPRVAAWIVRNVNIAAVAP